TLAFFQHGVEALLFFGCWGVFGWLGTLLIPYTLLQRRWAEWVEVSASGVIVSKAGLLAPGPRRYPLDAIREIALGWYDYRGEHESMPTLNLIRDAPLGFSERVMFGYWLAPPLKRQVFDAIKAFCPGQPHPIDPFLLG